MPMLTVFGRANSINVQKVLWCCTEVGVLVDRIDAGGLHGGTDTPEYRQINPTGLVPTLIDGSFTLWESNVIVRYLAVKYGGETIFPRDLERRFDIERWMDWQATALWPAVRPVFIALVRTQPEDRDSRALAAAIAEAERSLALLEAELAKRPFVAGEAFSIADIPLAIAAHRWLTLHVERRALPHVERWLRSMLARAGFREHVGHPLS